jgi:mannose-6-phosphate isomerase-like protein (cupin superfamily)
MIMRAFNIADLITDQDQRHQDYLEFLKVPDLSVGLYVLPAGGVDKQQPHTEDEIYYVLSGSGTILVGEENREVSAGSLVYVPANVEHHFHTIIQELRLLVVFAPAEYSQAHQHP